MEPETALMVNFELGNEMWKVNWSAWCERGTKTLTWIKPMTFQTADGCSIHWMIRTRGEQGHLPVNWVHMWQASCTLLGSALSKSYMISGDRWIQIVNFELSNKIMKGKLMNMTQACQMTLLSMSSHSSVFGRSWVQFLSGTQNFCLCPTTHIMLINSPFRAQSESHWNLSVLNTYFCIWIISGRGLNTFGIASMC